MSEPRWIDGDDTKICERCDERHEDECVPNDYDTMEEMIGE